MVGYIAIFLATSILIKILIDLSISSLLALILLGIWGFLSAYSLYIFYRAEPVMGLFNMIRTVRFNNIIKDFIWLSEFITFLSRIAFHVMFGFLGIFLFPQKYKHRILTYLTSIMLLFIIAIMYQIALSKFVITNNPSYSPPISLSSLILLLSGVVGWFVFSLLNGFLRLWREISLEGQVSTTIVTPLIPGITLPFLESIFALGFVMIVHELAHAVIAMKYNIPIRSTGLITYGAIPVGAFVEPDDDQFKNLTESSKKTDILLAGVGVNLFFSMIFFLVLWIFLILTEPFSVVGACISNDVIPDKYVIIKKIDGVPCTAAFLNNDSILETNYGDFQLNRYVKYSPLPSNSIFRIYDNPFLDFLYNLLFMLFTLNLIISITNMFPVYFIDGGQVLETILKDRGRILLKILSFGLIMLIFVSILFR